MARAVLVVVLMAGCGFQVGIGADGAPADDARDADIADGPIDAPAPTTCLGKWQAHQVAFSTPSLLANIPTSGEQGDPAMTSDELVLFFVWDGDQFVDHDIWAAIRPSLTEPFGESTIKSSISVKPFFCMLSPPKDCPSLGRKETGNVVFQPELVNPKSPVHHTFH